MFYIFRHLYTSFFKNILITTGTSDCFCLYVCNVYYYKHLKILNLNQTMIKCTKCSIAKEDIHYSSVKDIFVGIVILALPL